MASRAWPFEDKPEAPARPGATDPTSFARSKGPDATDGVIVRIGRNGAQLVLVDGDGEWDRWVFPTVEEASRAAEELGLASVTVGHYPEEVRVRMNAHRRPKEDFDRGPYREQGRVGPVIAYPENRPRDLDADPRSPRRPGH